MCWHEWRQISVLHELQHHQRSAVLIFLLFDETYASVVKLIVHNMHRLLYYLASWQCWGERTSSLAQLLHEISWWPLGLGWSVSSPPQVCGRSSQLYPNRIGIFKAAPRLIVDWHIPNMRYNNYGLLPSVHATHSVVDVNPQHAHTLVLYKNHKIATTLLPGCDNLVTTFTLWPPCDNLVATLWYFPLYYMRRNFRQEKINFLQFRRLLSLGKILLH